MISAVSSEAPSRFVDNLEPASLLSVASGDLSEGCSQFDGLFGKTNTLSQEQKDSLVSFSEPSSPRSPSCSPSCSPSPADSAEQATTTSSFTSRLFTPYSADQQPEGCPTQRHPSSARQPHDDYDTLMKLFEIDEHASFRSPLHSVSSNDFSSFSSSVPSSSTLAPWGAPLSSSSPFLPEALKSELESEFCQKHADDSFKSLVRRFNIDPHSSHVPQARPLYLPSPFPYSPSQAPTPASLRGRSPSAASLPTPRSRSLSAPRSSLRAELKPRGRRVRRVRGGQQQRRKRPSDPRTRRSFPPTKKVTPSHAPRPAKPSINLQAHTSAQSELRHRFVQLKRSLLSHLAI